MPPLRPQPKIEPQPRADAEPIDPPLPPERPKLISQEQPKPLPPEKPKFNQISKFLEQKKLDQLVKTADTPASRPRSSDQPSDTKERLNPSEISRLLSRETPQQRASTGRELAQVASLGSPTADAARMSPSMWGALDGLLQEQYKQCWSYLGLDSGHNYIPQIKVEYRADGGLADEPSLLNPPSDPSLRSLADSALRAVRRCNPLKIPAQYAPYFNQWKARILRFDPAEMAG
jgi:colicin import membrane protein